MYDRFERRGLWFDFVVTSDVVGCAVVPALGVKLEYLIPRISRPLSCFSEAGGSQASSPPYAL